MNPREISAETCSSTEAPPRSSSLPFASSSSAFSASAIACSPPARSLSSADAMSGSGPTEVPRIRTGRMPLSPIKRGASHCPTELSIRPSTAGLISAAGQKLSVMRRSSGVSEAARFHALCALPMLFIAPFLTRSVMKRPRQYAPNPASLISSALSPDFFPGTITLPRRSLLASMPACAVRVRTSCASRQGIHIT